MTSTFYYLMGRCRGHTVQSAVQEQLTKSLNAKVAAKINKATKRIAPIEAQIRALHILKLATVDSVSIEEDEAAKIIQKRLVASRRAFQQHRKQELVRLKKEENAFLLRLTSSVRRIECKCDALYHAYALGVALHSDRYKIDSVKFKSEEYAEFISSISSRREGNDL